jgi:hypothetical protein
VPTHAPCRERKRHQERHHDDPVEQLHIRNRFLLTQYQREV